MINFRTISILILTAILLSSASCDKNDDNPDPERYIPTDVDRARCAHIDQEAELGGYLYNLCLVNPWPAELPEVEVGGDPVLAAWINDTLSFVAYDPRESMRFNVELNEQTNNGQLTGKIVLVGTRATYENIDSIRIHLSLIFDRNDQVYTSSNPQVRINHPSLKGDYHVNPVLSNLNFSNSDGYGYGTFSLTLTDSTTNKTISLTDGRFHAPFGG